MRRNRLRLGLSCADVVRGAGRGQGLLPRLVARCLNLVSAGWVPSLVDARKQAVAATSLVRRKTGCLQEAAEFRAVRAATRAAAAVFLRQSRISMVAAGFRAVPAAARAAAAVNFTMAVDRPVGRELVPYAAVGGSAATAGLARRSAPAALPFRGSQCSFQAGLRVACFLALLKTAHRRLPCGSLLQVEFRPLQL